MEILNKTGLSELLQRFTVEKVEPETTNVQKYRNQSCNRYWYDKVGRCSNWWQSEAQGSRQKKGQGAYQGHIEG